MEGGLTMLEQLAMLSIVRLGDEAYGIAIKNEIDSAYHGHPLGSVYSALARMERRELIEAHELPPRGTRGGRRRRAFRVSAKGIRSLREMLRASDVLRAPLRVVSGQRVVE